MKSEEKQESGLGAQPEAKLYERAQAGCRESLNQLMDSHEPLVLYAVKRQNLGDLPYQEAIQAGRIGLWQAILKYDLGRSYRFSTYAYKAIVHQIWAEVKMHCQANKIAHATREWVLFFRHWEAGPAQRQAAREVQASLQALVVRLPVRLQRVIIGRYGLDGQEPQTLPVLGVKLGVCGERVRQLQVEALVWLRHPAHSQELRSLLRRHSLQEYEWAEELTHLWRRRRRARRHTCTGARCQCGQA
jgi:RNA polymerase sigma factor (sigma-70 family)